MSLPSACRPWWPAPPRVPFATAFSTGFRAPRPPPPPQYRQYKIIYRRYAGLFFSLCVDVTDNELLYLESIHLFVELLDRYFGNVCELDLVFNFHKVYALLDEYILAGEIQEVSQSAILERMHEIEKIMF